VKHAISLGALILVAGHLANTASAQEATNPPAPAAYSPLFTALPVSAPTEPPAVGLGNLWSGDGSRTTCHFFGEVGVGAYWMHGSSPSFGSASMIGTSLGVMNDRGFGVSAGWMQLSNSSTWSGIRRP
jgi:hypothetical protein